MALGGTEPVIIFKLYTAHPRWNATNQTDPDKVGKEIELKDWQNMSEVERFPYIRGIVPVYLGGLIGEKLTGVALDEADQTIDFQNSSAGGLLFQRNNTNDVSLTFRARRDNPIMIVLLSLISQLTGLIPTQKYSITMYYDSMFVLNGVIKNITQQTINNTNVKLVQMIISEAPEKTETDGKKSSLPNIAGSGSQPYTGGKNG